MHTSHVAPLLDYWLRKYFAIFCHAKRWYDKMVEIESKLMKNFVFKYHSLLLFAENCQFQRANWICNWKVLEWLWMYGRFEWATAWGGTALDRVETEWNLNNSQVEGSWIKSKFFQSQQPPLKAKQIGEVFVAMNGKPNNIYKRLE